MTSKALDNAKKKQTNDFSRLKDYYFHKNPPGAPMQCFDDTFVSLFEIALSLEMQNAFKQIDISCAAFVRVP